MLKPNDHHELKTKQNQKTLTTRVAKYTILTPKTSFVVKSINLALCGLNKNDENKSSYSKISKNLSHRQVFFAKSDGFGFFTPKNCKETSKLVGVEKKLRSFNDF